MQKKIRFPGPLRPADWLLIALAVLAACVLLLSRGQDSPGRSDGTSTQLEARLERVLGSVEGAGRVRVMVCEEPEQAASAFAPAREAAVSGVLVVAEGADDLSVSFALVRAVQALLGVDADRIEVVKMQEGG